MLEVLVVKAFVDKDGQFGNAVGVVVDLEEKYDAVARLRVAKDLGFSETVFVTNLERPEVRVFTGQEEITFAGHALLGASSVMASLTGSEPKKIGLETALSPLTRTAHCGGYQVSFAQLHRGGTNVLRQWTQCCTPAQIVDGRIR